MKNYVSLIVSVSNESSFPTFLCGVGSVARAGGRYCFRIIVVIVKHIFVSDMSVFFIKWVESKTGYNWRIFLTFLSVGNMYIAKDSMLTDFDMESNN